MKRRVLTNKANKRALRVIQATTGVKAPFRVLVDSSFLRMAHDGKITSLTTALKEILGGYTEVCFHPATHAILSKSCPAALPLLSDAVRVYPKAATDLQVELARSELKVIPSQMHEMLASKEKKVNAVFVASVNHDVKAAVQSVSPLLRLSLNPTAIWLETPKGGSPAGAAAGRTPSATVDAEGDEGDDVEQHDGDDDGGDAEDDVPRSRRKRSRHEGDKRKGEDSTAGAPGDGAADAAAKGPQVRVSNTDKAFMKHKLGIDLSEEDNRKFRVRKVKPPAKKGPANANPLARKKPQKRERFVSE